MPELTPNLTAELDKIASAQVYGGFEKGIDRELSLCQGYAKYLLTLNPGERMPAKSTNTAQRSIEDRIDMVHNTTTVMARTFESVAADPMDNNTRVHQRIQFLSAMKDFFDAWDYFEPALRSRIDDRREEEMKILLAKMWDLRKEAEQVLNAQKAAAAQTGVEIHAGDFETLATDYDTAAKQWLKWAIGTGVLLVVVVCLLTWWSFDHPDENRAVIAQVILGKLLIISILYFFLVLAARTYRANAHLAVINRHRAKSLKTFQTFATSASTPDTKNAVLLEATKCIYGHTSTGFLGAEEPSSPVQIVEILRAMSNTPK